MTAQILDGNAIAAMLRTEVAAAVAARIRRGERPPGLAVILVGADPASAIYVRHKHRDCREVGFKSDAIELPADTDEGTLIAHVDRLNEDPTIDGILVQLPLPPHIDANRVLERIKPTKDVDGYHPFNIGRLALRQPVLRSCTPKGIMELLARTGIPIRGLDATMVGASNHVGRPMSLELLLAGCTVTTAHKFTRDLRAHVAHADVLVTATGRPGLIRGEWIKPGAIVIDVGIFRNEAGRILGDVEFDVARERAAWITPVPGGVGPMTRIALLQNTLYASEQFHRS
jgi:methylenetetrahydrofolate dehydrogenase (NADP+)/methenyltetrahydrofolate cyclohydrolase